MYLKKWILLASAGLLLSPINYVSAIGRYIPTTSLIGKDATNKYFNPAGFTDLKAPEVVLSDLNIFHKRTFDGRMSNPGITGGSTVNETGSATTHGTGGGLSIIPGAYYAAPINSRLAWGITVSAYPRIGLSYDSNSILRYDVILGYEKGVDIAPSLAFQITPKLSVGIGPDFDYLYEYLKNKIRTQPLSATDSTLITMAKGWNYGWHAGLMYKPMLGTTIGLAYHSAIVAHLKGNSRFYPGSTPVFINANSSANTRIRLPFPNVVTLSVRQFFSRRFGVLATIEYQGWSIYNRDEVKGLILPTGSTTDVSITKNLHDAWYYGIGSHYVFTEKVIGFAGLGYNTAPASPPRRTLLSTFPQNFSLSLGTRIQASKRAAIDLGWTHVFKNTVGINKVGTLASTVVGSSTQQTNVVLLQLVYDFV